MKINNNKNIFEPFLNSGDDVDLINEYVNFDHLENEFDNYFTHWIDSKLKTQATDEEIIYLKAIINNIKFVLFNSPTLKDTQILIKSWNTTINTIKKLINNISNIDTVKEILKFNNFVRLMEIFLSFDEFITEFEFRKKITLLRLWFKILIESLVVTISHNMSFLEETLNSKTIINFWNFETKNDIIKFIKKKK